jgi:tartrate dehydratase alpha subunit/fumarate hydratase class I-like protein
MKENNKPRVYTSEILKDMISKITPEELELVENEMLGMVEEPYTNKEIRAWWLNQTEERRRNMVREYFKGGNSENINTLYGIMPEEMEEMYNINVDVVIMDWEEILFDFIDFYPCQLPDELFEWLKENYEIPKKKDAKHI